MLYSHEVAFLKMNVDRKCFLFMKDDIFLCIFRACRNEYYKMCPECYNQKVALSTTKPALSTTAVKKWK